MRFPSFAFLALLLLRCLAAQETQPTPAEVELPPVAFDLARPELPSHAGPRGDLRAEDPARLRQMASRAAYRGNAPETAVQFQRFAVEAQPEIGSYSLAIYHAMAGETDACFYWLQQAALTEGIAPSWPRENARLTAIVKDERFAKLEEFLTAASAAWAASDLVVVKVNRPRTAVRGNPPPVIVGLHGYFGSPDQMAGDANAQRISDEVGAEIIAPSATERTGLARFTWAGDVERDLAHIDELLDAASAAEFELPNGRCVASGFSEGGHLALRLASANPERFAGAIAMTPIWTGETSPLPDAPGDLSGQAYVVVTGGLQAEADRTRSSSIVEWLRTHGAFVVEHTYDQLGNGWPPQSYDNQAIWAQLILETSQRLRE